MVPPLKTDKILSQTTKQNSHIDPRVSGGSPRNARTEVSPSNLAPTGDNVDVSKAGRFFNEAAGKSEGTSDTITGQQQASALALLLGQQFEQGGLQALQAHAGIQPEHAATLLKT